MRAQGVRVSARRSKPLFHSPVSCLCSSGTVRLFATRARLTILFHSRVRLPRQFGADGLVIPMDPGNEKNARSKLGRRTGCNQDGASLVTDSVWVPPSAEWRALLGGTWQQRASCRDSDSWVPQF